MGRQGRHHHRTHQAIATGLAVGAVALTGAAPAAAQLAIESDHTEATELAGAGNGNGVIEPGEGAAITATLLSTEFTTITDLTGTLAVGAGTVATVDRATEAWPQVDFGWPVANAEPFLVTAGADHTCGAPLRLTLNMASALGSVSIPISVPTAAAAGGATATPSTGAAVEIPDGQGGVDQTVVLSAAGRVKSLKVAVTGLTHSYSGDLRLTLTAPDGRSVLLADSRGGSTPDAYQGTVFSDSGTRDIRYASAPFSGEVRPEEPLSGLDGALASGTWRLRVEDRSFGQTGVVDGWSLTAPEALCEGATPPPPPPPPPGPVHGHGHRHGHGHGHGHRHKHGHKPHKPKHAAQYRRAVRERWGKRRT